MSTVRFIVSTLQLLKSLERIKGGLATSAHLPTLHNVLFELGPGELRLTTGNGEVRLSVSLDVEAVDSARLAVPGRLLLDTLKYLPDQPGTFSFNVETSALTVKTDTSEYLIAGEDARGYPLPPEFEEVSSYQMAAGRLQRGLAKTVDFASGDALKSPMDGVCIRLTPKCLEFTASDGWGLMARYRQQYIGEARPVEAKVAAPARSLKILTGLLPKTTAPADVHLCQKHLMVSAGDLLFSCRLIDNAYPDTAAFFKHLPPHALRLNRDEFTGALRRVQGYVDEKTQAVAFDLTGSKPQLSAHRLDGSNEAREQLAGEYAGEPLRIGLRLINMLSILPHLEHEQVVLGLNTSSTPAMLTAFEDLTGEQMQVVLMPLAINL